MSLARALQKVFERAMVYDFDNIRGRIDGVAADVTGPLLGAGDWLEESWRDPDGFWKALARYHAVLSSPSPRSHPQEGFDFYYDMVLRHRPERTAMRVYAGDGHWRVLTYGELDERSTGQLQDWSHHGLQPGARVCLLLPVGEQLLVALVTAFRLGLVVSYLPPGAPHAVNRRLAALSPELVVTHRSYLTMAAGHKTLPMSEALARPEASRRALFTYAPGARVADLFSEHNDPTHVPLPLTAAQLYLSALRDGLLMLSLRPGDALATGGLSPMAHQPSLLVATLLCGATFVHIDEDDLANDPTLLANLPLRSVGLSAGLRDALLRSHASSTRGWAHWFRNPEEPLDGEAWRRFVLKLQLENVPCSNLLVDASTGGCVLWSLRRKGQAHAEVLPTPGRPWILQAIGAPPLAGAAPEATSDYGLYAAGAPERKPYVILVRAGAQMLYGGTLGERKHGRVYPTKEVVEAARTTAGVLAATVFVDGTSYLGEPRRALVCFTGAVRFDAAEEAALRVQIANKVGKEHVPERVHLVPLSPRLGQDGELEVRWFEAQSSTGLLHYKPRQPLFQLLTLLRHAVGVDGRSS